MELHSAVCRKERICSNQNEGSVSTSSEDDEIVQDEDVEDWSILNGVTSHRLAGKLLV